ncbi:MAG TPA: CRISPR system precrRNA processing endoribonuclease RAMP protein Cas6 [Terriglobales bacterium]|nr:CRISPR system precrRNA processing endoribonuclease RAMP protein Cas6 [Terriglobales bacterium]
MEQIPLSVGLFRFTVAPLFPLFVPAVNKGNMLRGGFGHVFRRLCCVPQCQAAKNCPLAGTCPYKAIFEPSPPAGSDRLSKYQDIPRPFVFRAPQTQKTRFGEGERFEFDLVLIGRALEFLPYFVLAFRELAAEGIGLNRAKCKLERVEAIEPVLNDVRTSERASHVIYSADDQLFRSNGNGTSKLWFGSRIQAFSLANGNGTAPRINVRFLTPTFLRAEGDIVRRPEFHHIFKRLRDRINALSTFFGTGPLDVDFRGLGERSEKVRTVASRFEWVERARTSSKTGQRHELSGFVGEATYEGDMAQFVLWLAVGELVHVGKHTAWGNGWMSLVDEEA